MSKMCEVNNVFFHPLYQAEFLISIILKNYIKTLNSWSKCLKMSKISAVNNSTFVGKYLLSLRVIR